MKLFFAGLLAATTLGLAMPAAADPDHHRDHHRHQVCEWRHHHRVCHWR